MIKIEEEDLLFGVVNLVGFLLFFAYYVLDFMAMISQTVVSAIPGSEDLLMAYTLVRVFAYLLMVIAAWIVFMVDAWWIWRVASNWYKGYRRENL